MPSFRLRTTILYLVLAAAWIYLSDNGLATLVDDPSALTHWQSLKGLAFILLNGGLIFWLAGRGTQEPAAAQWLTDSRVRWTSAAVFLVSMALDVGVISKIESTRVLQRQAIALDRAADHAHALEQQIDRTMSATYALAAMVRQGQGRIPNFEALTTQMLPLYPGVSALVLAPGGVVTEIVPLAGNERAIGIDILGDPKRRPEALKAMSSRMLTIDGPRTLSNGSSGLVGRLAVFLGDGGAANFWGFVTAVAKMDELMRICNLQQMAEVGYHYRLVHRDANAPETVLVQSTPDTLKDPVVHSIQVSNSQWELRVVPISGWHA
ncbi:MAG: PAS/PAC and GAF sensor-containing diguanylate cyclase/phosphodiesterase, partial [Comamonadaceae bacterium]